MFSVPPKVVLEAEPFAAAQQRSIELTGRGISRYTYGLRTKILEVDRWLSEQLGTAMTEEIVLAGLAVRPSGHEELDRVEGLGVGRVRIDGKRIRTGPGRHPVSDPAVEPGLSGSADAALARSAGRPRGRMERPVAQDVLADQLDLLVGADHEHGAHDTPTTVAGVIGRRDSWPAQGLAF